jgi:hypothetical protein
VSTLAFSQIVFLFATACAAIVADLLKYTVAYDKSKASAKAVRGVNCAPHIKKRFSLYQALP